MGSYTGTAARDYWNKLHMLERHVLLNPAWPSDASFKEAMGGWLMGYLAACATGHAVPTIHGLTTHIEKKVNAWLREHS